MKTKSLTATLGLSLLSVGGFAQQPTIQKTFWTDPFNHPMLPAYATVGVLVISVLVLAAAAVAIGKAMVAMVPDGKIKETKVVPKKPIDNAQLEASSQSSTRLIGPRAA